MLFPAIYLTTGMPRPCHKDERRGAVLLIVLVILVIFATLGMTFVFYAESEAVRSSQFKDSVAFRGPDIEPEMAMSMFLQQLIFDCKDDASGLGSALRGHSLLRNMYGLNYTMNSNGTITIDPKNNVPFNGSGRLHYQYGVGGLPGAGTAFANQDDYMLVNYSCFPPDSYVRDPERFGVRTPPLPLPGQPDNRGPFINTGNAPYTAADLNCMALAAVQADGTILLPSFHRPWTGFATPGLSSLDPNNPNWSSNANPALRYMILRPRPGDHPAILGKPGFSPPDDPGGDVRNAPATWQGASPSWAGTGKNDSIWLYTGAPVFTLPDGRQYTFLCAPLIFDLDGKLNINVAGNLRAKNNTNASNMGVGGPTETNPNYVLNAKGANGQPEWSNLFNGITVPNTTTPRMLGHYGAAKLPSTGPTPALATPLPNLPHFYAKIDFDGVSKYALNIGGTSTTPWTVPGPYQCWPAYSPGFENGAAVELQQSPLLYNGYTSVGDHRIFTASELNKIYRYGDTNTDAMVGDLWQLLPYNFNSPNDPNNIKRRNLITTLSFDRRESGILPWLYNNPALPGQQLNRYELNWASGAAALPIGLPLASPTVLNQYQNLASKNPGRDFGANWRGQPPNGGIRISLNPTLRNYPAPDSVTNQITNTAAFLTAQNDRTAFATGLFQLLVKVTGAYDLVGYRGAASPAPPTAGEINALRYLAQLAVNIVDFIDTDDYITPFNWYKAGSTAFQSSASGAPLANDWVYGTEIPKVVINEVYCQYSNDAQDPGLKQPTAAVRKATYYFVDTWAELCNPFMTDTSLTGAGNAQLYMGKAGATQGQNYPIYRLMLTTQNTLMHKPTNALGRPDTVLLPTGPITLPNNQLPLTVPATVQAVPSGMILGHVDKEFGSNPPTTGVINALNGGFAAPNNQGSNTGFYLIGPMATDASGNPTTAVPFPTQGQASTAPRATVNTTGMRYKFLIPSNTPTAVPPPPTLMLQRLLCPYLPPNETPGSGIYNPYITVDYFEVPQQAGGVSIPNQAATHNGTAGTNGNVINPPPFTSRTSVGRVQPYQAQGAQAQNVPQINQPQHTFFYHNVPAPGTNVTMPSNSPWPTTGPKNYPGFDWLVHLDRIPNSPMELLHVSGYKPHELTQQFAAGGLWGGHQAPWFEAGPYPAGSQRLYRFLDFVQTPIRQTGATARIAGKPNLNTMWDEPVFDAVCDAQSGSCHFTQNDVTKIWNQLLLSRNPVNQQPGLTDQYFMPLSAGVVPVNDNQYPTTQFPNGLGIGNTILRPFTSSAAGSLPMTKLRLFESQNNVVAATNPGAATSPFQRFELLSKIYNNVTTRSNCFAVFLTVGFFQVNYIDPHGRIYLGQELGRSEGRNIRHRMFAIIDRSVLDGNYVPSNGSTTQPNTLTFLPNPANPNASCIAQEVLNQNPRMLFNPHSMLFKDLVPYFTVIE